ncbi:MAG: hypothetical protein MJ128_05410 [Mogibacterium sp.]|nr:hypothetical protein [Mogibacterium sp.]
MGILKEMFNPQKSQKKDMPKKENTSENTFFEQSFIQSHTFKGYKRFQVSYYGYAPAEKGVATFRKYDLDLEGAEVRLKGVKRSGYLFLDVFVHGFFLGSVTFWGSDDNNLAFMNQYLFKGLVEKAHIRIDYETIITSEGSVKREKIYLFLKPKQQKRNATS